MSQQVTLTKLRLVEGVWHGQLKYEGAGNWQPEIEVTHLDQRIDGVEIDEDRVEECWFVRIPIPASAISDGVQTFVIRDKRDDDPLGSFTLISGEPLAEDIRSEVSLLREELDMLKRAFRRHCKETMGRNE